MIVINDKCKVCNHMCNAIYFQRNFKNWTSGNDDVDKFIQNIQLLAHDDESKALEWIPYVRFNNIEDIKEDRFGEIYRANWIDGIIEKWDNKYQNWKRNSQNIFVILKSL